jgi:inhibitor of cysteine peptidase
MKILTVLLLCGFRILAADNTNEVKLAVGQTYSIDLDSNPTTGYSWKLANPTNSVFMLVTNNYEPGKHPAGMAGVGGVEHWTIKATQKGRAQLTLEYMRPWEKVAVKTNSLTIVCQ